MKKFKYSNIILAGVFVLFSSLSLADTAQTNSENHLTVSVDNRLSSKPEIKGIKYYGDIPANPKRVVSTSGAYTGYLAKLGFNLVGVSKYDINNPALKEYLTDAKVVSSTELEAILALEPDVIIAGSFEENAAQLADIAPLIMVDYGASDYLNTLLDFAAIFNQTDYAENWLKEWKAATSEVSKAIKAKIGEDKTFTVLGFFEKDTYLFGNNWGRGGELIYQALGFKAPKKIEEEVFPKGYLSISREVINQYTGDYLAVNIQNNEKSTIHSSLADSKVWQDIPAVKNNQVLYLTADLFIFNDPISLTKQLEIIKAHFLK